jgi:hypothetical protein
MRLALGRIKEEDRFIRFSTPIGKITLVAATTGMAISKTSWEVESNDKGETLYAIWGGKRITLSQAIDRFGKLL